MHRLVTSAATESKCGRGTVAADGGGRLKEAGLGRGGRPPYVVRYGFVRYGNVRDPGGSW